MHPSTLPQIAGNASARPFTRDALLGAVAERAKQKGTVTETEDKEDGRILRGQDGQLIGVFYVTSD